MPTSWPGAVRPLRPGAFVPARSDVFVLTRPFPGRRLGAERAGFRRIDLIKDLFQLARFDRLFFEAIQFIIDRLLEFCDRSLLTLPLGLRCGPQLPQRLHGPVESRFTDNAARWQRIQAESETI